MAEWLQILSLVLSGITFSIFCLLATIVVNKASKQLKEKQKQFQKKV